LSITLQLGSSETFFWQEQRQATVCYIRELSFNVVYASDAEGKISISVNTCQQPNAVGTHS